jgi:AcrR family transcriptional regulator
MIFIVRRERLDDAKRVRLTEAAIVEFADRGFASASYNKIIERSGLSKGTVYYYFDNKDSLLLTVLDEICERFRGAIGDLELPKTKEGYWAAAWEYHKRAIQFFFDNPLLGRVMYWLSKEDPMIDEPLSATHKRAMCFFDSLLVRGLELGAVRDDLPVETVQRLMHTSAEVLAADLIGEWSFENAKTQKNASTDEERQQKIERFMVTMHDFSKRILTP